jgi:hypothetical protein
MSFFARFAQYRTRHTRAPLAKPTEVRKSDEAEVQNDHSPRPAPMGTVFALGTVLIAALTLFSRTPTDLARHAAICVGVGLAGGVLIDLKRGLWNLPRADLFALLAFYFLTLVEFLFPQANFNTMVTPELARAGINVVLLAFAGLLIGRHLLRPKRQPFEDVLTRAVPVGWLIALFWLSALVGYLHMLIAVNFNVLEMIGWFMEPRFTQPWGRGKYGDWKALLYELSMLLQLLPPLAGIMIARRRRFPLWHLVPMVVVLGITLFCGFASGTRNVFASYLVTFLIGYAFALTRERNKELLFLSVACALLITFSTYFMLEFRTVGLKHYLRGDIPLDATDTPRTLYVDYNLHSICRLVEIFPQQRAYLGLEIPYLAIIRPIPRAIWKSKPEGMSTSIEEAMGVQGVTIAASFAGEAYMSGGNFAVLFVALGFGAIFGWWGALASARNSELGILIYASGFFAAVISMRSLLVFTTALLPTVVGLIVGTWLVGMVKTGLAGRGATRSPTPRVQRGPDQRFHETNRRQ